MKKQKLNFYLNKGFLQQRLIFKGKQSEDNRTLLNMIFKMKVFLNLILRLRYGDKEIKFKRGN